MKRLGKIIVAVFLFTCGEADGAVVRFADRRPVNADVIERMLDRPEIDSTLIDSALTILRDEGYLDATTVIANGETVVNIGHRYRLTELRITGDSTAEMETDYLFRRTRIQEVIADLLTPLRNDGYYFATLKPVRVSRIDSSVSLNLKLTRGPQVVIGRHIFSGLTRSDDAVVARYLSVDSGQLLTEQNIDRLNKDASLIPFVVASAPVAIRPREGYNSADLEFQFSEKRPFRFEGGIGYIADEDRRLVWSLNLDFTNLFGGGRTVRLQSERREKRRTILDIRYGQPIFWLGIGHLDLGVSTRDYRDRFYEFGTEAGYRVRLGPRLSTGLTINWKSVEPSDNQASYSRFGTSFKISRNSLDDLINPKRGLSMVWSIGFSYRRYRDDSLRTRPESIVLNETRNTITLDSYHPVSHQIVLHLGLNYSGLETEESLPPLSELVLVGGPGSLRGFRNEQFPVIRAAIGTIEPRLRVDRGYLFTFYDAAWLNNRRVDASGKVITDDSFEAGFGFGLALTQHDRFLKLSLAWNRDSDFDQPRLAIKIASDI